MSTIATLAADVVKRMGNRTDIATRAEYWTFEGLIQLTSNADFEELEVTGADFNLTANTGTYALSSFITAGQTLQTIMDFIVYTDIGTNTVTLRMRYSDILENDKITPLEGTYPTQWSRIGSSVMFRPVPNAAYTVFMRYRRQHPLDGAVPYSATTVLLPVEWDLIIKYLAMANGYDELKEHDRAATLRARVWGGKNPSTGIDEVGFVKPLLMKRQREMPQYDIPLRPHNAFTRTCPM